MKDMKKILVFFMSFMVNTKSDNLELIPHDPPKNIHYNGLNMQLNRVISNCEFNQGLLWDAALGFLLKARDFTSSVVTIIL